MQIQALLNSYGGIAIYLGLDLLVIFLMTYVLYFRRHWRADLLLSYVALNIGSFVTMSLLTQVRVDLAVGFGAADGAAPAPGSDLADGGDSGSSTAGRHDGEVRQGV